MLTALEVFIFILILVAWACLWGKIAEEADNIFISMLSIAILFAGPMLIGYLLHEAGHQEPLEQQVCEEVEGQVWVNDKCYVEKEEE